MGHTLSHLCRLLSEKHLLFFDSCSTASVLLLANRCLHKSQNLHKQQLRSNFNRDRVLADTGFTTRNKELDSPQQETLSDYFWRAVRQTHRPVGAVGYFPLKKKNPKHKRVGARWVQSWFLMRRGRSD